MKNQFFTLFIFLFSLTSIAAPEGYKLIKEDEFNGVSVDTSLWNVMTEWRDNAKQNAEAVSVNDGILSIRTTSKNGKNYTGFLTTKNNFEFTYGYVEARLRFHGAPGEWCGFWIQSPEIGKKIGHPDESGTEIDIVEHRLVGQDGKRVDNIDAVNTHWDGYGDDHKHAGFKYEAAGSLNENWHNYAVLWTPEKYVFYLDGIEIWHSSAAVSKHAEHLRLTCEVKDNFWAGKVPAGGYTSGSNVGMDADWVRVYQK